MNNGLQVQYQYLLFKIQTTLATSDWIYRLFLSCDWWMEEENG